MKYVHASTHSEATISWLITYRATNRGPGVRRECNAHMQRLGGYRDPYAKVDGRGQYHPCVLTAHRADVWLAEHVAAWGEDSLLGQVSP